MRNYLLSAVTFYLLLCLTCYENEKAWNSLCNDLGLVIIHLEWSHIFLYMPQFFFFKGKTRLTENAYSIFWYNQLLCRQPVLVKLFGNQMSLSNMHLHIYTYIYKHRYMHENTPMKTIVCIRLFFVVLTSQRLLLECCMRHTQSSLPTKPAL